MLLRRFYDVLVDKVHFYLEIIIIDPNMLVIGPGIEDYSNCAFDFISVLKQLRNNVHMS